MGEKFARQWWWKVLSILCVAYAITGGFLIEVPQRFILNESIRNLYFHVPMWFTMIVLLATSAVNAIQFLASNNIKYDIISIEAANTGTLFGIMGISTGMLWGKFTWGAWWVNDPKLNGVAIALLIYMAYFVLRSALDDQDKKAKISSVYNIFSFAILIPLIYVLPRLTDSLHPGSGGNPAFNQYDLDNTMRLVFYPACIGWILLGVWIFSLKTRISLLKQKKIFSE